MLSKKQAQRNNQIYKVKNKIKDLLIQNNLTLITHNNQIELADYTGERKINYHLIDTHYQDLDIPY